MESPIRNSRRHDGVVAAAITGLSMFLMCHSVFNNIGKNKNGGYWRALARYIPKLKIFFELQKYFYIVIAPRYTLLDWWLRLAAVKAQ